MSDLKEILKSNKLKITPARERILSIFYRSKKPLNVEMVFNELKKDNVDQVTIYRTIETFLNKNLIHKVDLRKESVFYEIKDSRHHHHHIVCVKCGLVEELDFCINSDISLNILNKSKSFKIINDHSFEFFGLCKKCN